MACLLMRPVLLTLLKRMRGMRLMVVQAHSSTASPSSRTVRFSTKSPESIARGLTAVYLRHDVMS